MSVQTKLGYVRDNYSSTHTKENPMNTRFRMRLLGVKGASLLGAAGLLSVTLTLPAQAWLAPGCDCDDPNYNGVLSYDADMEMVITGQVGATAGAVDCLYTNVLPDSETDDFGIVRGLTTCVTSAAAFGSATATQDAVRNCEEGGQHFSFADGTGIAFVTGAANLTSLAASFSNHHIFSTDATWNTNCCPSPPGAYCMAASATSSAGASIEIPFTLCKTQLVTVEWTANGGSVCLESGGAGGGWALAGRSGSANLPDLAGSDGGTKQFVLMAGTYSFSASFGSSAEQDALADCGMPFDPLLGCTIQAFMNVTVEFDDCLFCGSVSGP